MFTVDGVIQVIVYCNAVTKISTMQQNVQIKQPIAISQFNGQLLKIQNILAIIFS